MVAAVIAALLAFVSTNIDDVFVLLILFGQGRRPTTIVLGQYLGFGAIVLVSLLISAGALLVPAAWVGFLGVAPFVIGLRELWELRTRGDAREEKKAAGVGVVAVAAVALSNGGDDVAVYVPLLARRAWPESMAIVTVFMVMVGVQCWVAHLMVRTPVVSSVLDRWGRWIASLVLIGLGIYVFADAGTAAYVLGWLRR